MTLDRFDELLDAYGADAERWPAAERAAALALLDRSETARRHRAAAAHWDDVLRALPAAVPSESLSERVLAAAPAPRRRRHWPLVAAPLAAAAVLVLWFTQATVPTPTDESYPLALLGTYETPTDVLLGTPGLDLLDSLPGLDCTVDDLGCLSDADLEPDHAVIRRNRRMTT